MAERDPEEAQRRSPRYGGMPGHYWTPNQEGRYQLPELEVHGHPWHPRWPVFGVSWEDAVAYCRWRSEVEGRKVRLPMEQEWEKAARGTDGRYYPWGDLFDPTFCRMRESRETAATLEPVGTFELDESPYGVRDAAGCISEWCQEWFSRKHQLKLVKGGAWNSTRNQCRAARRHGEHIGESLTWVGFRTVRPLKTGTN